MKTIKHLLYSVLLIGAILVSSCTDYLDISAELADNLTIEEVFNNPGYTRRWHGNIYKCISQYTELAMDVNAMNNPWSTLIGEITANKGSAYPVMQAGFNAGNAGFHRWATLYKSIRQATIFLENGKPLGALGDLANISVEEMERMKTEAKFFIAYSYFCLFELYGPVPILETLTDPENTNIDFARVSVDEMVLYIDRMLEEAANSGNLPETIINKNPNTGINSYNFNEMVRPTKLVVMALRAKLWVYAASPLFNGGFKEALTISNYDGKKLFPEYQAEKWLTAKKRLEEFLSFASAKGLTLFYAKNAQGEIDPNLSVYELYQNYNDEIIWATSDNQYNSVSTNMEPRTTPRDIYNSFGNVGVTQETIDKFFMDNGLSISDPGSGYNENGFVDVINVCNDKKRKDVGIYNMYANREARFYAAVAYQGRSWHIQPPNNANYTIDFSKGGGVDNSKSENPRVGTMLYKFKNRELLNTGTYKKSWARPSILLRLADFYLYYAEVCNEINASDPNVIIYLDKVRERAGIPGYRDLAITGKKNIIGNQTKQRSAIVNERHVEFLAEGQRYFDVRRWMIGGKGEEADQYQISGMNMDGFKNIPIGQGGSFFKRTIIESRAWVKAMYFYPIPADEINKSKLLVQNPLWE